MDDVWQSLGNPVHIEFTDDWLGTCQDLIKQKDLSPLWVVTGNMLNRLHLSPEQLPGSTYCDISPNPDISTLFEKTERLLSLNVDSIFALGGGSVIDTAKFIKMRLFSGITEEDRIFEYTQAFQKTCTFVALPTTHGSGSEVTKWATIWDKNNSRKLSLVHEELYPQIALLDPNLTSTLPEDLSLTSTLDSISHALESMWSKGHNPISDLHAIEAISICLENGHRLKADPANLQTRKMLLYASTLAGLAFSRTRTAIAHSISYPLTLFHDLPHGIASSISLPAILNMYSSELEGRLNSLLVRLKVRSTEALGNLIIDLAQPELHFSLSKYNLDHQKLDSLVAHCFTKGRSDNFLYDLNSSIVRDILYASL